MGFEIKNGILIRSENYEKEVILPAGIREIGENAFHADYTWLEGGDAICRIVLPDGVEKIGDHAFADSLNLVSISIPDSVKSIGKGAFRNCKKLKSITIPKGVEVIREDTFMYCKNLQEVQIPDSVVSIEASAFYECGNLHQLTIPESVKKLDECFNGKGYGSFFTGNATIHGKRGSAAERFAREKGLKFVETSGAPAPTGEKAFVIENHKITGYLGEESTVVIPDGVTEIGESVFKLNKWIKNVVIPGSVKKIGEEAFARCYLTSVCIPGSVAEIGRSAFFQAWNLTEAEIAEGVKIIGSSAFEGCSKLAKVTISGSADKIGYCAFRNCKNLQMLTFSDGVKSIDSKAFEGCISLKSVVIPESVTEIGNCAFGYSDSIKEEKVRKFVIFGKKDSAAERYAKENGFKFKKVRR